MNGKNSTASYLPILIKAFIRFFLLSIIMMFVLFLAAGRLDWWEGWVYIGQGFVVMLVSRGLLIAKNPDTALERAQAGKKEDVKSWDKILMPLTALYLPIISWVIAGLDVRFGWTPDIPDSIQLIGLAALLLGNAFGTWAMLENRFFSSHVRIQTDRGHTVINTGPYKFVRHPGYAGGLIAWIAAPVFFGSYWLAILTVLAIAAGILRTAKEDQVLQAELPGYQEYTQQVRYRLIPGIW
jgi:protein-S-isoprenylcysteine O-methyltransferase Ste14